MSLVWQFSTEPGFSSALIRFGTRCDWSHVDAVLPDGSLLGARIRGGVQIRPPGYENFTKIIHYSVESDCETKFYDVLKSQIGKPYDWRAIIGFGIGNRDWQETDSWFCSELQIWAMIQAGFFKQFKQSIELHVDRLSPRDHLLLFSPWIELLQ